MVGHCEGLCEPFSLVVARPRPYGVDVAPVVFRCRDYMWVSVDLGGRGEDVDGIVFPGYLEGVS